MKPVGVLSLLVASLLLGCARPSAPTTAASSPGTSPPPVAQNPPPAQQPQQKAVTTQPEKAGESSLGGVARVRDLPVIRNDLKQLSLFYNQYCAENGKVKSADAFKAYIRRDAPGLVKALDEGAYVVVVNVTPGANTVIAYERTADRNGLHAVAMGDGSVSEISNAELQKALKGQGS